MAIGDQTVREFLGALAARTPTPGGGAVAGLTAASSAALACMVVRFSLGRAGLEAHQGILSEHEQTLERLRARLLSLADEDASAYAQYAHAAKLPKDDPARGVALAAAKAACLAVPTAMAGEMRALARVLSDLRGRVNEHLESDRQVARHLGVAAARSVLGMIAVNLPRGADAARAVEGAAAREAIAMLENA